MRSAVIAGSVRPRRCDLDAPLRILLADRQSLFRDAVKVVLDEQPGFDVVGVAADGMEAIAEAERALPDVAVVDAALANGDGVQATREITSRVPGCRVLVLGADDDEDLLISCIEAGALGFVSKVAPLVELIDAARAIHRGEACIPAHMLGALIGELVRRRRGRDDAMHQVSRLTTREREVLALLVEGRDNDGIAQVLVISPQTARTHVQNVLTKLGVHSRLEAVAFVRGTDLQEELAGAPG